MARILGGIASSHTPTIGFALDAGKQKDPVWAPIFEGYRPVQQWLADKRSAGVAFTEDQREWLEAIKDHIASSLAIEQDDLGEMPFNTIGGLGRAYELFGEALGPMLDELNLRLAA